MMRFRPRYSLLTLLILTALVAGGVKLWYGPHHVVEWTSPIVEEEYSYTRNWRGDKILHGPSIRRIYVDTRIVERVAIDNYRDGVQQGVDYVIWAQFPNELLHNDLPHHLANSPLNAAEALVFDQVIDRECQRIREQGYVVVHGYLWPYLLEEHNSKN